MNTRIQDCALCDLKVGSHPIKEGENVFCCIGCHAVYGILMAKNQLEGFEQHPIFIQAVRSGLISNPKLLDNIQKQNQAIKGEEREKLYLEINDMWCPSCAEIIRLMIVQRLGVLNCIVDYTTDLASIEFSPKYLSKETLIEVIKSLGYSPQKLDQIARKAVGTSLYIRFAVAAFCSLNLMMLSYPLYATYFNYDGEGYGILFAWISLFISLPVLFYSAWPIWKRFMVSLKTGLFGMETLVSIGVWSAFYLSLQELLMGSTRVYFDSMSVIIVFVLLGKIIEARAKFSAKESLMRLTRATPRRGRKRFLDGKIAFVPVKEIAKGDELLSFTGEKLILDGVVIAGVGACDESLMTGESMPVSKKPGDLVLAGTVVLQGHLEYRVTSRSDETALHRIIEMIEKDIGHKSTYIRAADQIIKWFVPTVICIAFFSAMYYFLFPALNDIHPLETAFMRALAVLLISCPCAIGIAAPAAESYLLNGLASLGAIVRNRGCLPFFGKEDMMIFDKTGTVTEGKFKVFTGLEILNAIDKNALYTIASYSTHPIACAIAFATVETSDRLPIENLEELVGYGLKSTINGQEYLLGSAKLMKQHNIQIPIGKKSPYTSVYFSKNGQCLCELILGDKLRPDILKLVESLKPAQTILISGDAESTVAAVAELSGFKAWISLCTPLEKREYVDKMRQEGKIVCMLGDGINDAPALTAANVGISVVSASDMSIQVSDILLTTDQLNVLIAMRALSVKGQLIIKQNLFWAFFYNVIGIALAAGGILSPIFAAFAMSISGVTVLFNARRLR